MKTMKPMLTRETDSDKFEEALKLWKALSKKQKQDLVVSLNVKVGAVRTALSRGRMTLRMYEAIKDVGNNQGSSEVYSSDIASDLKEIFKKVLVTDLSTEQKAEIKLLCKIIANEV